MNGLRGPSTKQVGKQWLRRSSSSVFCVQGGRSRRFINKSNVVVASSSKANPAGTGMAGRLSGGHSSFTNADCSSSSTRQSDRIRHLSQVAGAPAVRTNEEEDAVLEALKQSPETLTGGTTSNTEGNETPKSTTASSSSSIADVGYLGKILNARVYDACIETDLQYAHNLSALLENEVYLKREDQQPVFSFKIRGAYNKMAHLSKEQLDRGVVACSAGNHAQGVAKSATILGCRAVIVMPLATPMIKVDSVRLHGGNNVEVRLFGQNYDEAAAEATRLKEEEGLSMIHPFNDPYVIAGQGTIGLEILKEMVAKPLEYIFICCGGGGMLAGIAAYVKLVRPSVKVIGVEAADAAGMTESLKQGKVTTLGHVGLFADGAAVKTIGDETFRICHTLVDDMVTVTTDQICNAIKASYNDARVVLEPAGALAVAGMKKYVEEHNITNATMVATTSGANMDFTRLRFVSERADDTERMIAVTIPDRPGTFRELYDLVWPRNVTEFSYRYDGGNGNNSEEDGSNGAPTAAHILMSFQPLKGVSSLSAQEDFEQVMDKLKQKQFHPLDLTYNGMAKDHVRHLAGGRSNVPHERLFRFDFPESPGALKKFLESLNMHWNVSLFHYRNHGDDYGRVLCAMQVPDKCNKNLSKFLDKLGYNYEEETNNTAYKIFLHNREKEQT